MNRLTMEKGLFFVAVFFLVFTTSQTHAEIVNEPANNPAEIGKTATPETQPTTVDIDFENMTGGFNIINKKNTVVPVFSSDVDLKTLKTRCSNETYYQGYNDVTGGFAIGPVSYPNFESETCDEESEYYLYDCHCANYGKNSYYEVDCAEEIGFEFSDGTRCFRACCGDSSSGLVFWSQPADADVFHLVKDEIREEEAEHIYVNKDNQGKSEKTVTDTDLLNDIVQAISGDDGSCVPGTEMTVHYTNMSICYSGTEVTCDSMDIKYECGVSGEWEAKSGKAVGCKFTGPCD